ncbi:MAG: DUF2892 domain-containing protein [Bacteroidetes bacterium]|nr:MAG: DUF2892 domain-containing protein [Bacteroidota bacterium]
MKCNVGENDKLIRILLGISMIATGIILKSWIGYIGIIPIFTAVIGFCPLYPIAKVNTCKR